MIAFRTTGALVAALLVSACGGSGTTSGQPTTEPPPSTPTVSRIFTTDVPFQDRLATVIGVSPTAAQTILEFERRNLLDVETNPIGSAVYTGKTAMELGSPGSSSRLLEGDVVLFVDFPTNALNGQLQSLVLHDMQGGSETVDVIRIGATTIDQGRYATTLDTAPFRVAGGTASQRTGTANARVDGAFVSGGAQTLGVIQGTMTIGSDPTESLLGVYEAD